MYKTSVSVPENFDADPEHTFLNDTGTDPDPNPDHFLP